MESIRWNFRNNEFTIMNLLRQIEYEVKSQWTEIRDGKKIEMVNEDCPPSFLRGWTDDNPSLWEIDNAEKPNKERILVALGRVKKDKEWDKITYLVFDKNVIDSANLNITPTNGNTGDSFVDLSKTHYEIKNLSAKSLCTLIYHIMKSQFQVEIYKKSEFNKFLYSVFDSQQMKPQLKAETMSIEPRSIMATTDTLNRDIEIKKPISDAKYYPISSESIDSTLGESASVTS